MDALHPVVTEPQRAVVRQETLAFVPVEIAARTVDAVVRRTPVVRVALLRATPDAQPVVVAAEAAVAEAAVVAEHASDFLVCCDAVEDDALVVEAAVVDVRLAVARPEVLVAADANQHVVAVQAVAVVVADVQPVAVDVLLAVAAADANQLAVAKAAVAVA